jgi:hypothetical protein
MGIVLVVVPALAHQQCCAVRDSPASRRSISNYAARHNSKRAKPTAMTAWTDHGGPSHRCRRDALGSLRQHSGCQLRSNTVRRSWPGESEHTLWDESALWDRVAFVSGTNCGLESSWSMRSRCRPSTSICPRGLGKSGMASQNITHMDGGGRLEHTFTRT